MAACLIPTLNIYYTFAFTQATTFGSDYVNWVVTFRDLC